MVVNAVLRTGSSPLRLLARCSRSQEMLGLGAVRGAPFAIVNASLSPLRRDEWKPDVIMHVKYICTCAVRLWPRAVHVYDPVDVYTWRLGVVGERLEMAMRPSMRAHAPHAQSAVVPRRGLTICRTLLAASRHAHV